MNEIYVELHSIKANLFVILIVRRTSFPYKNQQLYKKDMRTVLAALGVLCFMGSCSSGMTSSKGIVCDATMNTVAIVTDKNDTLSFSTMNANKEEVDGLLLNDTLEVFYTGKYTPGMQASKLVQYPQSPKLGGDRDEHGCIGSAGYVWCEVQQVV